MSPNTYLDPRDLSDPHPSYDAQRYDDESATRQVWRARDQESQDQPVDQTMLSADCKEAGRHQEENGYYDTQVDGRAYRDQNQGYEGDLAEGQGGYDGGYYGAGHGDDGTAEEEEDGRYEYDEERVSPIPNNISSRRDRRAGRKGRPVADRLEPSSDDQRSSDGQR